MNDTRRAAIALAALELVPGEPSDLSGLLRNEVQRAALFELDRNAGASQLGDWLCEEIDHGRIELWEKRLERLEDDGQPTEVLLASDSGYPERLGTCWDMPPILFSRGTLNHTRRSVAIVGSRVTSPEVEAATHQLAAELATHGVSIVSGLAAGIDTAAHEGALEAEGHTVAVMGTGITRVFPAENELLARRIISSGAVISQFAPNAPRTSTTFLRRNCTIAGMTEVSLVMSGAERSGSRHESEQAIRYGRPVYLWAPTLASEQWAQAVVRQGLASFFETPVDILEALGESSSS